MNLKISPKQNILNCLNQLLIKKKLEEKIEEKFDGAYFIFEKTIGGPTVWEEGEVIYQLKKGELIEVHNPFDSTEYGILEDAIGFSMSLVQEYINKTKISTIYTIANIPEFKKMFFNLNLKEDSEINSDGNYEHFYQILPLKNSIVNRNIFGNCKFKSLEDEL